MLLSTMTSLGCTNSALPRIACDGYASRYTQQHDETTTLAWVHRYGIDHLLHMSMILPSFYKILCEIIATLPSLPSFSLDSFYIYISVHIYVHPCRSIHQPLLHHLLCSTDILILLSTGSTIFLFTNSLTRSSLLSSHS